MALDRPLDGDVMPQLTAARYYGAIDDIGSPVPSSIPHTLAELPSRAVDQQMVALFGHSLAVEADNQRVVTGPCQTLDSSAGLTLDAQVREGDSMMLKASQGGSASISLGLFAPPRSLPLLDARLGQAMQEWVRIPNTGRSLQWRLRIKTQPVGDLQICGAERLQAHSGTSVFSAPAAGAGLDAGWTSVRDAGAYGGQAARLPAGTVTRSWRDAFMGTPTSVAPRPYDVWFRVRVANATSSEPEMVLGLLDFTTYSLVGQTTFRASDIGTSYTWVRAVKDVTPNTGRPLVFLAEFNSHTRPLSTDWFIDEAMMVPAGLAGPTELTPTT
jgi:hypothetical protein